MTKILIADAEHVLALDGRDEVLTEQLVITEVVTVEETHSVALEGRDEILIEQVEVAVVVGVAEQGPPGPPGIPGPAGGQVLQRKAGMDISALLVVYEDLFGSVWPADPDAESDVLALLGVTVSAAEAGQPINVQRMGHIDDEAWQLQPGKRVFLGGKGRLTQEPPQACYDVLIGMAISSSRLLLNIQDPIELE
ncbi:hypothetical protein N5F13_19955 [Comamonas thiooxydans]|uniref:hypothetical protein n=1 Tax=Comamonas thiooxydans TaxID=363952 RepID=UPI00244B4ABD|nr:hypothetical protein [Comamonas thiooxydans]MDH1476778.1 hypothetical protein [Comamonas thiooxydans]